MRNFAFGALAGIVLGAAIGAVVAMTVGERAFVRTAATDELKAPEFPDHVDPVLAWRLRGSDGHEVDLADFRERVLFVNLWATWCAPCIAEMPHIEELASRFHNDAVAFLIVSEEAPEDVAPFVAEQGWQLPVYTVESVPPLFQTGVIPATYVLDEMREMVFKHIGSARWDDDGTVAFIENLLRSTVQ